MTDKNIQMSQRNTTNDGWDNLFPITSINNVTGLSDQLTSKESSSNITTGSQSLTILNGLQGNVTLKWSKVRGITVCTVYFQYQRGTQSSIDIAQLPSGYYPSQNLLKIVPATTHYNDNSYDMIVKLAYDTGKLSMIIRGTQADSAQYYTGSFSYLIGS